MTVLNVAIIGQGRSGRDIHGAQLSRDIERFRIAAVVDPLEDRRERAKREYGCDVFEHYAQLKSRKDLDLVVNSAPSRFHVPITLDLLNNGFNVLCEKPFARTTADVDRMIEASTRSGKLVAVFQQSRYAPYFRQVQDVIASRVLGETVQISIAFSGFSRRYDWQTLTSEIGGNLHNTGPHPLDQALQLFGGSEMPNVHCIMRNTVSYGDADDHTLLLLTREAGPIVHLEVSSCCTFPGPTYQVYGTRGGLKGDTKRLEWQYYDPRSAPGLKLICTPISKPDGTPSYCTDSLNWIKEEWNAPSGPGLFEYMCNEYYSMLYNTLVDGAPLEITVNQVRRQIAVLEECRRQNPHIWSGSSDSVSDCHSDI